MKKVLKKLLSTKNKQERESFAMSFQDIRSIAILYSINDVDQERLIKQFVAYLREFKKEVLAMGYIEGKIIPPQYTPKLAYDYYCDADLKFNGKAKSNSIQLFLDKGYDVLIDASILEKDAIKSLVKYSNAKLKAGSSSLSYHAELDLQFEIENNKNLKYLLKLVDHYLQLLKNE